MRLPRLAGLLWSSGNWHILSIIVLLPSTYSQTTEDELAKAGVSIVIYANQLLRSAYPAMVNVAESILRHGRASEAEDLCMPIKDIINLIPERS